MKSRIVANVTLVAVLQSTLNEKYFKNVFGKVFGRLLLASAFASMSCNLLGLKTLRHGVVMAEGRLMDVDGFLLGLKSSLVNGGEIAMVEAITELVVAVLPSGGLPQCFS